MQKSVLLLLVAVLTHAEICQGEGNNSAPGLTAALAVSEADTIVESGIGKLKKLYSLKAIIKDIPGGMIAGIEFDKKHRLYVATYGYGRFEAWTVGKKPIYRVETDGRVSVFAEVNCGLLGILGIDEANSVYVTTTNDRDAENGTDILKIAEDGKATTFSTGYKQPCSGMFDSTGNFYFVEAQQKKIYRITPQGGKSVILDINSSSLAAGLLFHGMAFDSSFSTCYLVGYSAETGKVLKCSMDKDWKPGTLVSICDLPSPKFAWVDRNGNLFVTYGDSRIAKIIPDGTKQLDYNVLYSNMLDDFDKTMYVVSKECELYRIMEDEAETDGDVDEGQNNNAAPRIIEFSMERNSLSYGGYVVQARVEDEACCGVHLFLLLDGKSDSVSLERDSSDSTLYRRDFDGYTWGDSLAAWLEVVDDQGSYTVSDTLDFCFMPFVASDLDSDGGVDIFDLLSLLRILSGSAQPSVEQRCTGDLDRNGRIDIFDLLALLKLLAPHRPGT